MCCGSASFDLSSGSVQTRDLRCLNDVSKQHVVFPAVCLLEGSCLVCMYMYVTGMLVRGIITANECNNRLI